MEKEVKIRILRYLEFLENEITDFNSFKILSFEEYIKDKHKRRDVERWIENLINTTIDISRLILITENKNLPETYKEIISSLSLMADFEKENTEKLSSFVKLRNIITHHYLDLKWHNINNFIQTSEEIFNKFLQEVKKYLNKKI